jgi:glycerol-3-phosphate acyltransferase PlsY
MPSFVFAALLILVAYLVGALPFGYLIARAKGVDLFKAGSGNIGATNVGRVLGRKFGILVFLLDFLKGALPVALVPALVRLLPPGDAEQMRPLDWLLVAVALAAFLGHLFPVYLGFRGGKGVATGFGAVFVLTPGPAAFAVVVWLAAVASFRIVSLASLLAAAALCFARIVSSPPTPEAFIVTGFCLAAAALVVIRHRANLGRLRRGEENRLGDRPIMDFLTRALHLLALAFLLGGSFFFNFLVAPSLFASFGEVVRTAPSDRTAGVPISEGLDDARKRQLGSALAGAAVGPIFPVLFGMQAACVTVALVTALGWWKSSGKVNRCRVYVLAAALAVVVASWPISQHVSELRLARFSPDAATADAADKDFKAWHFVSLGLSFITIGLAFAATVLAAKLPPGKRSEETAPAAQV